MIAVDTNILVAAFDRDDQWQESAAAALGKLAEGSQPWGLPWFVVVETLRVCTHPRIMRNPAEPGNVWQQIEELTLSPTCRMLAPGDSFAGVFGTLLNEVEPRGNDFYDLQIAAVCIEHGVREFWTADRGFRRFRDLRVLNPLEKSK